MLISNGITTRNIAEKQLAEYKAKGYDAVTKAAETPSGSRADSSLSEGAGEAKRTKTAKKGDK